MADTVYIASDIHSSYETMFTVDETLDDLLMKFLIVDFATYGFIKVESSPANIINVSNLIKDGNYEIYNWEGGPENLKLLSPVNLVVTHQIIEGKQVLLQMIPFMMDVYYRTADVIDKDNIDSFTSWNSFAISKNLPLYIGVTEPSVTEPSFWINTTVSGFPTIYIYNSVSGWVGVGSVFDALHAEVYDTKLKGKDIFRYFDEKWGINNPTDEVTFFNVREKFLHHKEIYGHMTKEEREMFLKLISVEEVNEMITQTKVNLIQYIHDRIDLMGHEELHDTLAEDWKNIHDHFRSPNHSSKEKKKYWNAKAEPDHTHFFDDRVQINAEDILDGVLSLDVIPDSAIHKLKNVLTHADRFQLTKDDVQNGDSVSVLEETEQYDSGLYMVIDDTKLDSDDGYVYYRTRRFANIDYVDIIRRPNNLSGYGIEDGCRIVETANQEGIFKFVYPYYTEDDTINYLITKAILDYGGHIGDILDAIENAMKPGDVEGIWSLAKENLKRYEEFAKMWEPYNAPAAHDVYDEIERIFYVTESIYEDTNLILYD